MGFQPIPSCWGIISPHSLPYAIKNCFLQSPDFRLVGKKGWLCLIYCCSLCQSTGNPSGNFLGPLLLYLRKREYHPDLYPPGDQRWCYYSSSKVAHHPASFLSFKLWEPNTGFSMGHCMTISHCPQKHRRVQNIYRTVIQNKTETPYYVLPTMKANMPIELTSFPPRTFCSTNKVLKQHYIPFASIFS